MSKIETKNNPYEFAYAVTNQTFALEAHFGQATFENNEYPLELYDSFSRLKGAIISENKKVTSFNIPKKDLAMLLKKSDFALNKLMEFELANSCNTQTESLSPAYTVKIKSGKLKGRTPAEILLENPENKDLLNSQYSFIKKNMADPKNKKYEKSNQEQLNAILDAAKLLEENKLSADNVVKNIIIPIYTPGFRPLTRKTREDGKCFVYEIKIVANLGADFPIEITVENYYAPYIINDNKTINVKVSEKDESSVVKNPISLPADMWEDICYNIKAQMRAFEITNYTNAFKMAKKQDILNKEKNEKNVS